MHKHVLVVVYKGACRDKKAEVGKSTLKDNETWNQNSSTRNGEEKKDKSPVRVRASRMQ